MKLTVGIVEWDLLWPVNLQHMFEATERKFFSSLILYVNTDTTQLHATSNNWMFCGFNITSRGAFIKIKMIITLNWRKIYGQRRRKCTNVWLASLECIRGYTLVEKLQNYEITALFLALLNGFSLTILRSNSVLNINFGKLKIIQRRRVSTKNSFLGH